jgi:hypothetical protein
MPWALAGFEFGADLLGDVGQVALLVVLQIHQQRELLG